MSTSLRAAGRAGRIAPPLPRPREAAANRAGKAESGTAGAVTVAAANLAERRHAMIAEAAYFRAELRNFEPGHDIDDWLAAEAAINSALNAQQTAKR